MYGSLFVQHSAAVSYNAVLPESTFPPQIPSPDGVSSQSCVHLCGADEVRRYAA